MLSKELCLFMVKEQRQGPIPDGLSNGQQHCENGQQHTTDLGGWV